MSEFANLYMNDAGFFMLISGFGLGVLAMCVMAYFDLVGFDHTGCDFPPTKDKPHD